MLILMNKNENNQKAAEYLQKIHADADDKRYFVIDIEQHFFKKNITPEEYAANLIESGLPDSIQDIYLLTSEITQDHFMAVFAHHLARCFAEFHHRTINIHIPSYLSCEITLIVPPIENQWKIYGINRSDLTHAELSFATIFAEKNKNLIWEGSDLLEWMNDPQQTYSCKTYVWENQQ